MKASERDKQQLHMTQSMAATLIATIKTDKEWEWAKTLLSPLEETSKDLRHFASTRPFLAQWASMEYAELRKMWSTNQIKLELKQVALAKDKTEKVEKERQRLLRMYQARDF